MLSECVIIETRPGLKGKEDRECRVCNKIKPGDLFYAGFICKLCRNAQVVATRKRNHIPVEKPQVIRKAQKGLPTDSYFAGFVDGEGCIGIVDSYSSSLYHLQLTVSQVKPEVLRLLRRRFSGSVMKSALRSANHRDIFIWKCESKKAEECLEALIPFLIVKKKQAQLALRFRHLFKGENVLARGNSVEFDPAKRERILELRRECYLEMRGLNKRGKKGA